MKFFTRKRMSCFTVTGLMIVGMIVAILMALTHPSYVNYAWKAKSGVKLPAGCRA